MINLIRNWSNTDHENWAVTTNADSNENIERKDFATIEQAAEFMLSLGISDDDIDKALIDMYSFGHVRAIFKEVKYEYSQDY